ncbi:MAG: DJ-1/PfpI family protein [Nakamurella sp.]
MMQVAVVLFDGFELLDVFGPVELLHLSGEFEIRYVGPVAGPVRSSQGAQVIADHGYDAAPAVDVMVVPGGPGTRLLVQDDDFLHWVRGYASESQVVCSVCTGSAVLAAAGVLKGLRATSNKLAFDFAMQHGRDVSWVRQARWVHDGSVWTSSGVAAGMDMTAALIAELVGPEAAELATLHAELEVHTDSTRDPFADAVAGPAPGR